MAIKGKRRRGPRDDRQKKKSETSGDLRDRKSKRRRITTSLEGQGKGKKKRGGIFREWGKDRWSTQKKLKGEEGPAHTEKRGKKKRTDTRGLFEKKRKRIDIP